MHDEEMLNDLLGGRLDAEASARAVRRLRAEPELREHLLDMIAVRAVLPAVIDSTELPADEECAAVRVRFAERVSRGVLDDPTEDHLESCASCAIAFEVFAASTPGGSATPSRRKSFVRSKTVLAVAASVVAVVAVAAAGGARWLAGGGSGGAAGGVAPAGASGGAAAAVAANAAKVPDASSLRVVASLPAPVARSRTALLDDIDAALSPMRSDPALAEFVAAVDDLVAAVVAQSPDRNPKYGRVLSLDAFCPEEIMWAVAELEPDLNLRQLAYNLTRRGTSVSAAKLREAILRERALGSNELDRSLFARFVKAYGTVDQALIAAELAAVRDDTFETDPDFSERRLQSVVVAAYTFSSDPYVMGLIADVAQNGVHSRARACAILHLASRREAVGDVAGTQAYLNQALPYLTHGDASTRVFAELAFERHADPAWIAALAEKSASDGDAGRAAALRKLVGAAEQTRQAVQKNASDGGR